MNPAMASLDVLIDPFRAPFMQRALVAILVLAIPSGLLGTWVVTRRLAFVTHAVGHATFPALVIAVLAGWSLFGTALAAAILLALGLAWMNARPVFANGVAVAIVLSATLALGAVLVSDISDPGVGANSLLFGSLLATGWAEVVRMAIVAALAIAVTLGAGRDLASATFQRDLAIADGRPAGRIDALLLVLLAATVAVAVQTVGSLLVASLLVVPSATARLVTRRIPTLHLAGIGFAACEGVIGLWLAYELDAPPGAGIAVVATAVFVVVAAATTAWRARRRHLAAIPI
jgi:ABC-type Mn2+/Zn2+ transport system permease subunit